MNNNKNIETVTEHYDMLIDEGTDFSHDPPVLQKYMDRWTGPEFIVLLELDDTKEVLEIGIGTKCITKWIKED